MKKETKEMLVGGIFILFLIGVFLPDSDKKEEQVAKKEQKVQNKKILTLGEYKNSSEKEKKEYIGTVFLANKWDKEKFNKYLIDYYNCMGDFAYQKDQKLTFIEVFKWCDNERANNKIHFYSHINELDIRKNGHYNIGYDKKIALLKKEKMEEAKKLAISLQEKSITKNTKNFKKYKTPLQPLEDLRGLYTVKEISKNEVVLYTAYFKGDSEQIILEEEKRNFIDAVFQTFIYTNIDFIKIGVITKERNDLSFQASIKREDALKVTQKLLHVNKFDDLIKVQKIDNTTFTSYNSIANRARYNDQGAPTLNAFFEELSKVTY